MRWGAYQILSGWGLANAIVRGPTAILKFVIRRMVLKAVFRALR